MTRLIKLLQQKDILASTTGRGGSTAGDEDDADTADTASVKTQHSNA